MRFHKYLVAIALLACGVVSVSGQTYQKDIARQSARSDFLTGGTIERAELLPGEANLRLTLNVPSFDMTLWQGDKEIRKYYIGVGLKDYPIFVGLRRFRTIIWNPAWIPPNSPWVAPSLRGKVIGPADRRNPLGKIKIPLGYGYLIHQAKSSRDLGGLVSHGCIRVMRNDLYQLNDDILLAYGLDLKGEVAAAKRNKRTYVIELDDDVHLEVSYDAIVVENGILNIYPDVYGYRKEKVADLRKEMTDNGIDESLFSDTKLKQMLAKARGKFKYSIPVDLLREGKHTGGKVLRVVPTKAKQRRW